MQKLNITSTSHGSATEALHLAFPGRIQFLENIGCRFYQLLEYPEALCLTDEEVVECAEKLNSCKVKTISAPLLKIAQRFTWYETSHVAHRIKKYTDKLNGHVSVADFWISVLSCKSEQEILNILQKNPRLIFLRNPQQATEKVNVLLEHGLSLEAIKDNTYILKNVTAENITSRCQQLVEHGVIKTGETPALELLSQSQKVFVKMLKIHLKRQSEFSEKISWLAKNLQYPENVISGSSQLVKNSLSMLKLKVPHVLQFGFSASDILMCPEVLSFSMEAVTHAMKDMEDAEIDHIKISMLKTYLVTKKIGNPSNNRHILARALRCNLKELPSLKDTSHLKYALVQDPDILEINFQFLLDCGFAAEDIQQIPLVIGHNPDVLVRHWNLLTSRSELKQFSGCLADSSKVLNTLQYFIERDINFQLPVVLKNVGFTENM